MARPRLPNGGSRCSDPGPPGLGSFRTKDRREQRRFCLQRLRAELVLVHGLKQAAEDTILAMMGGVGVSAVGTSIVEGTLQFDSRSMRSQLAQTPAASRGHRALSPAVAMCSKGPILCWHSRRKGHRPFEEACVGGGIDRGQGQAPLEDCAGSGARDDGGHGKHHLEEVCIGRGARIDRGQGKQPIEDVWVGRGGRNDLEHEQTTS